MSNKKRVIVAIRDSFLWLILTTFVGLIQILLYLAMSSFVTDKEFELSVWMQNGTIIAFSLALVSSIFFDNHFQKNHKKINCSGTDVTKVFDKYFDGLFYKLLPWVVVILVTVVTMLDIVVDKNNIKAEYLYNTQLTGVVLAYIYTFYFKYCSFYVNLRNDI